MLPLDRSLPNASVNSCWDPHSTVEYSLSRSPRLPSLRFEPSVTADVMSQAEMGGHQKSGERVKINVGGTVFETTISTLTRLDNTVLSTMVANRWRNQEEIFVDRSPTYFSKILDYLRDGENVTLPRDDEAREALRKEAEFYNLPDLSKMCTLHIRDIVQWKESAIEMYWKYFVRYLHELEYFEKRRLRCMACGDCREDYVGPTASIGNVDLHKVVINYEDWIPLRQHMPYMKGKVTFASFKWSCCSVEWGSLHTHIPQSALRKSRY
ncbi:unnamed protein product [Cylicocyclus nassatus]|uniref:BTB domain-containing protein n=1 Tax=Cylicocyclus nassatus TaxID=53992 RepID=A0AA36GEC0_CYLNA|nr:unnamed protein product [Cylicocyclus nassatus]